MKRSGSAWTFAAAACLLAGMGVACDDGPDPVAPNTSAPQCSLSTAALDFGTVQIGSSVNRSFKITNTGGGTLSGTVTESCADYTVLGVSTFNLGAGLGQTFTLRYTPSGIGPSACAVELGTACGPIPMSGTGEAPTCEVTPTTLDFGPIAPGSSGTETFTIRNIGTGTLSGTVTESCGDFSVVGSGAYSLAAGQEATFTVVFTPTQGGTRTCDIHTGSAACGTVTATGGTATGCAVSTDEIDFGTVSPSTPDPTRTFTISNPGSGRLTGRLTFDGLDCGNTVDGPNFEIVGLNTYDIGPGETEIFTVRFSPAGYGTYNCTLNTGNAECPNIQLTGIKL